LLGYKALNKFIRELFFKW